jgi:hypothetical protein
MTAYGGLDVQIRVFLTSALVRCEWSASHFGSFNPRGRAPGTHWIGGWVVPRAGLDDVEKSLDPTRDSNSDPSVVQTVSSPYNEYPVSC